MPAPVGGFVHAIDSYALGELVVHLGGGRAKQDDAIDPAVGLVLARKVGDAVRAGEPLAHVHRSHAAQPGTDASRVAAAFRIEPTPPKAAPLVLERRS